MKAICNKIESNIAFTTAEIYQEQSLKLVATGEHTKAIVEGI